MQQESAQRVFEQKEQVEDRRHITQLLTTITTGYFMANGKNKKNKKCRKKKRNKGTSSITSASGSSKSDSN